MVLEHWGPFHDFRRIHGGLNRYRSGLPAWDGSREPDTWAIPVDVVREGEEIVVHASLPGVDPDDIEVSVEDNILTIKGSTKVIGETRERK